MRVLFLTCYVQWVDSMFCADGGNILIDTVMVLMGTSLFWQCLENAECHFHMFR